MYTQSDLYGRFCVHTVYVQEWCIQSVAQVFGYLVQVSADLAQVRFYVGSLRHWRA